MKAEEKRYAYRTLEAQLTSLLDGVRDSVAAMATTASLVHDRLAYASWTGFYRVVGPGLLRIGPYQGPVGCLEIEFGKGVCGAAAAQKRTQIVPDVHSFPGHIACDANARSEIVVPVFGPGDSLFAVLDLDSHRPDSFDELDREGLERLVEVLKPSLGVA